MNSNQFAGLPPREQNRRSTPNGKRVKKQASTGKKIVRVIVGLLVILFIGIGMYSGYLLSTINDVIDLTGTSDKVAPEKSAKKKPITILLLGTDYRPETGTHLSDVNMVVSMNPDTKSATVVSLPRDTKFEMDGYRTNKLNAFYPNFLVAAKKSGISAEAEMKTMMSKYFDISIDYVVVLNFQAFRDVVDSLGGVTVSVDADMCYRDKAGGTNINLKKGVQHLEGDEALGFVRYRKSNCSPRTKGSDDFDRNRRQNEVLHALIDQAKSLNGVLGAGKVIKSVGNNMVTDLESDQMKNIIATYWDISKENVDFVPVTGDWKSPYVYIHQDEFDKARQALNDTLQGVTPIRESDLNSNESGE